jgi:hypothetical protein
MDSHRAEFATFGLRLGRAALAVAGLVLPALTDAVERRSAVHDCAQTWMKCPMSRSVAFIAVSIVLGSCARLSGLDDYSLHELPLTNIDGDSAADAGALGASDATDGNGRAGETSLLAEGSVHGDGDVGDVGDVGDGGAGGAGGRLSGAVPERAPVPQDRAKTIAARAASTGTTRAATAPTAPAPTSGVTAATVDIPTAGSAVGQFAAPADVSGASLTMDELAAATGLSTTEIASLEGFGLIEPMAVAGTYYYDEDALTIGKLVADFSNYGVEPRHLRLYRNAVEREAGLIEQVVTPLLRQRNPEARQRAVDAASELARLGQALRSSLLRRTLRSQFRS